MGRKRRRHREPVVVTLDRLEAKHTSGLDAEGVRWKVRGAPVGGVVRAQPGRKQTARRLALSAPGPDSVSPPCPAFGTCGGCQLQEMNLAAQRREKSDLLRRLIDVADDAPVVMHPVVGVDQAYGYRNKVELSWGTHRFVPESDLDAVRASGTSLIGSFVGFHPPGWFGRIVPLRNCLLATPAMNEVLERIADLGLQPAWDTREHTGTWRHLVLRDAGTPEAPQVLVTLVTSSDADPQALEAAAACLDDLSWVTGVVWVVTDRLAEVAHGELRAVLRGEPTLRFTLSGVTLTLPHDGFFQVNTPGAHLLVDTVRTALGDAAGGTLLDLYCGAGALGLTLAAPFDRVIGIEEFAPSIETARSNAAANGIDSEWHAGRVEDVLPTLALEGALHLVVDPPRAGLHPRAARFLADLKAESLVYVSCGPASLGRDRKVLEEGGWQLAEVWGVDLFPQTHHTEAVARFVRTR